MIDTDKNNIKDIVGIDITQDGLLLSYFNASFKEPITVADDSGRTKVFPIAIAKDRGLGRWYAGEDAVQKSIVDGAIIINDLYNNAVSKNTIEIEGKLYTYEELFSSYLRRIIEFSEIDISSIKKIAITVPVVSSECLEVFSSVCVRLGIKSDVLSIIDHKESFIYYTLSQSQNVFANDVALFEYSKGKIYANILSKNTDSKPVIIDINVDFIDLSDGDKDDLFCDFINRVFKNREITSVFLVGDGFSNDWMNNCVTVLCENRRVFLGDNLYSKGACFAAKVKYLKLPWNYMYIGDHDIKMNLSLKVNDKNDMVFVSLVNAGENWYESGREYEVILDGTPKFECWIQSPNTRKSNIHMIELREIPKRDNRTTRLRISAKPLSDVKVLITIKDLGFGDIAPSSGKVWEHIIDMDLEYKWEN